MCDYTQIVTTNRKVRPIYIWIDFNRLNTSAWIDISRAATLSSATINCGCETNAIVIRRRWPPSIDLLEQINCWPTTVAVA